eukprot:5681932-Karenia_brevis.AAC.1
MEHRHFGSRVMHDHPKFAHPPTPRAGPSKGLGPWERVPIRMEWGRASMPLSKIGHHAIGPKNSFPPLNLYKRSDT